MHSRFCQSWRSNRLPAIILAWVLFIPILSLLPGSNVGPGKVGAQGGEAAPDQSVDYGNWANIHGDAGHSGAAGFTEPVQTALPEVQEAWRAQIATDPVAVNGLVIGGQSMDGPNGLRAVSLHTGEEVWTNELNGYMWTSPAFDRQGRVFVEVISPESVNSGSGQYDGTLWALEASTGQKLWKSKITTTGGTPVVDGSTILVYTTNSLEALSTINGESLWSVDLEFMYPGVPPAVSEGLAVVRDGEQVRALFLNNGTEAWNQTVSYPIWPVEFYITLGRGLVVTRTEGGENLTAFELNNGSQRWKVGSSGGIFISYHPAIGPDALYIQHLDSNSFPSLLALNLTDGWPKWNLPLDPQELTFVSPIITPVGLLNLESGGVVRVRDPATGNATSLFYITNAEDQNTLSRALLALVGDRLLVTTPEGLIAYGTPAATITPPEPIRTDSEEGGFLSQMTSTMADEGGIFMALLAGFFLGIVFTRFRSSNRIAGLNNQVWQLGEKLKRALRRGPRPDDPAPDGRDMGMASPPTPEQAPVGPLPDHVSRAVIVCGAAPLTPAEQAVLPGAFVIAADSGANYLHQIGRAPDMLIGDFDSIRPEVLAWCRKLGVAEEQYPMAKDATDGELAVLAALDRGASEVMMVCALGGRADHSYANMGLLELIADKGAFGTIVGPDIDIYVVTPDQPLLQPTVTKRAVSLMPLSEQVVGIYSRGLRWPLSGSAMHRTRTLGISNETTEELIEVRVTGGTLLVGINRPASVLDTISQQPF